MRVVPISCVTLLLLIGFCHAQTRTLAFDLFDTRAGLSDNYILSMLQDRAGFLWLGTRDGLTRYDGHSFTSYRHNTRDPASPSDGGVDHLLEDPDGTLWAGTSGGLDRFDRATGRFVHFGRGPAGRSLAGARIISLCPDDRGGLWAVTGGSGGSSLCRIDRRSGLIRWFRCGSNGRGAIESRGIISVANGGAGAVWITTHDRGIYRYQPSGDRFISYPDPSSGPVMPGAILRVEADGSFWCCGRTGRRGIVRVRLRNGLLEYDPCDRLNRAGIGSEAVTAICRGSSGLLWIGTGGGIYRADERSGGLLRFAHNPAVATSLSSNDVQCILEDRDGNIWIGSDAGVNRINRRSWCFTYYSHDPLDSTSLGFHRVRSICLDRCGSLWVGSGGGGLDVLDRGAAGFRHYDLEDPAVHAAGLNVVNALYEDPGGMLWVGTNAGLIRFARDRRSRTYYVNDPRDDRSINSGGVWDILQTRDGALWAGTIHSGLNRLDRATGMFTRYANVPGDRNSLSDNQVHCIHEDGRGCLWIGSDGGLDRFDPLTGRWRSYTHDPADTGSLSNNRVWYIHESSDGIFWVGTSGGGFDRFDPSTGRFRQFTSADGLANDMVCGIVPDDHENLWISTNNGLSKFTPATRAFKTYTTGDGIPFGEFHFKACCRDRDRIILGGSGGVIAFDPDSVRDDHLLPSIAITSFKIFGDEAALDTAIDVRRSIRLDHDRNFFTIEFAALDFTNPSANRYLYKLEGFDPAWRSTDGRRSFASYTDIPPGEYRFKVLASNADGVWNSRGRTLDVVIDPAFWQTLWFKSAVVLLVVSSIGAIVLLRFREVRRKGELERRIVESQLKALQAQMNPHFVFNSLNSILQFIATHDSAGAHKYLVKFSRLMRSILESSRSDSLSLNEEIDALHLYLDLESLRFGGKFTYEIDIDPTLDLHAIRIPPMLIQPYVENAIRHGLSALESGGRLGIALRWRDGTLVCLVQDNGIGRARAAGIKARTPDGSPSAGMSVTADRLATLNALSGRKFTVSVTDIFTTDHAPAGTRVELHIAPL